MNTAVARALPYALIAVLFLAIGSGVAKAAPPIDIFRLVDGTDATRVAKVDAAGNVATTVSNLPARTVVSDGKFFSVTALVDPNPVLNVPSGVVLTDAKVSFSVPENVPNSASLFISDGARTYVYQIVNDTTFEATVHLESGITSNGGLYVELSCYNIVGNHCQGALMWSGYRP